MSSRLQSIIESAVRAWFPKHEMLTNYRPTWLRGLEIDIYLPALRVAIEVHGSQHRLFCPKLHGTLKGFIAQRKRDQQKRHLFGGTGILLITVHQSSKRVMGGLQTKLSKLIKRRLVTPESIQQEWRSHRRYLNSNPEYIRIKVRKNGLCAVNKASSRFLKSWAETSKGSNALPRHDSKQTCEKLTGEALAAKPGEGVVAQQTTALTGDAAGRSSLLTPVEA